MPRPVDGLSAQECVQKLCPLQVKTWTINVRVFPADIRGMDVVTPAISGKNQQVDVHYKRFIGIFRLTVMPGCIDQAANLINIHKVPGEQLKFPAE